MKLPIIMIGQTDFFLFPTVEKACSAFEADDVDYGLLAFDLEGHQLCLKKKHLDGELDFLLFKLTSPDNSMVIEECASPIEPPSDLKERLIKFLVKKGLRKEDLEKDDVQNLLTTIQRFITIDDR